MVVPATYNGNVIQDEAKLSCTFSQSFADLLRYNFTLGDQLACVKLGLGREHRNVATSREEMGFNLQQQPSRFHW